MNGMNGTRGGMATVNVELEAWAWFNEDGNISLSLDQNPDNVGDGEADLEFTFEELIQEFAVFYDYDYEELLGLRAVFDKAASHIDTLVDEVESDKFGVND